MVKIVLTDPRFHGTGALETLPDHIEPGDTEIGLHILAYADQIGRPGETVTVREWYLTSGGVYRAVLLSEKQRKRGEPGFMDHRVYVQEQN